MQVKCAYSGLTFACQYFPAAVNSRDLVHPSFYLSPSKLISLSTMWSEGKLEPVDSYLLFLALLESTELVEFRTSVLRTEHTNEIVALNMEHLVSVATKILHVPNKRALLPVFSISHGCNDLSNVSSIIGAWDSAIADYANNYLGASARNKLLSLETLLERSIKNSTLHPSKYSTMLANWAELAGHFPTGETLLAGGQKVPLNLYWKNLIVKACLDDSIFTISSKDLAELISHCEEEIPHGSIYAHSLMKALREAKAAQDDFFSGGRTTFKVLASSSSNVASLPSDPSAEAANIARIISSAPAREPARGEYDTFAGYLKAKVAWDMAQRAATNESEGN